MTDKKLTLSVSEQMHAFLDTQPEKLGVTTSEYLRRLIIHGSQLELTRQDLPGNEGRYLYIASRQPAGELAVRSVIPDIFL